jgi:hypothetical protein
MKKSILLLICLGVHWAQGTINNYEELIHATIQACNEPNRFLSSAYTNDVIAYRSCCTNAFTRCAADLSLAVCLMYRMDNDEDCVGDNACYDRHQALVTNILASADIGAASWLRYAAAVEFVHGLNFNRRFSEGFVHSTNMLAQIAVNSPEMGITNFWNGMARLQQCEGITLQMAFQINAAIQLAEQKRYSEMFCYTNELPAKVSKKLVEVLQ